MYDLKSESAQDQNKRRSLPSQLTIISNTTHIVSNIMYQVIYLTFYIFIDFFLLCFLPYLLFLRVIYL